MQKFSSADVVVIPISIDENKNAWLKKSLELPTILRSGFCIYDTNSINIFKEMFSIIEIPRTIILNQENKIEKFYGANPSNGVMLEQQIDGLLHKNSKKVIPPPPPPPKVPDRSPSQK